MFAEVECGGVRSSAWCATAAGVRSGGSPCGVLGERGSTHDGHYACGRRAVRLPHCACLGLWMRDTRRGSLYGPLSTHSRRALRTIVRGSVVFARVSGLRCVAPLGGI